MKDLGFLHATKAGISISITDLVIPDVKEAIVSQGHKDVLAVEKQYLDGAITNGERYNKVIAIWTDATENVADAMFKSMQGQDKAGNFNPIYIMADSGARGSKQQLRQLAGMRGLMARPSGEIIENPHWACRIAPRFTMRSLRQAFRTLVSDRRAIPTSPGPLPHRFETRFSGAQ